MKARTLRITSMLMMLFLVLAACGGDEPSSTDEVEPAVEATADAVAPTAEPGAEATADAAEPTADPGGEAGGAVAEAVDLSGAEITVSSKEFTEQLILGEITKQALAATGATVNDQTGLQGSAVVREALVSGEVDAYWEYTGTGWITHLGNTEPVEGEEEQFDAVKEADAENGVQWLSMAPMNNTYALAVKADSGPDITKLSEVAGAIEGGETGLCAASEFLNRDDGLPGLEEAYGFSFDDITEVELGLVYTQVGSDCAFGEVFATDGRIAAQNLKTLEDDENFFPKYNLAMNMRQDVYEENSAAYDELFGAIASALTNDQMIELNKAVDVDGENPADVAEQFLVDAGIISG